MDAGRESDIVYVAHMLECIERVLLYSQGDSELFLRTKLVQDGVLRNLQIMAESSQRLTEVAKAYAPEVPWRAIAGFRNVIVHEYLGVDLAVIWQVVVVNLPLLKTGLHNIQIALGQK